MTQNVSPGLGSAVDEGMYEEAFVARAGRVELFRAERKIVEQLLGIPSHQLALMTSSDLSERSGASRSSIDRLSRKLGYPGLKEMRKALILERAAVEPSQHLAGRPEAPGEIALSVTAAMAARATSFGQALARSEQLEQVVEGMLQARVIQFFGSGESAALCATLYMRLVRLGLPVQWSEEFHTQVTLASLMSNQDFALCVSFSGATKSTVWAAEQARAAGAKVGVLTGNAASPLARSADLSLVLPTGLLLPGSAEVLDRLVAGALGEILYQCFVMRRPDLAANSLKIDDTFGEARL